MPLAASLLKGCDGQFNVGAGALFAGLVRAFVCHCVGRRCLPAVPAYVAMVRRLSELEERMMKKQIAVLGAGSWGSVLANVLVENGHQVQLWSRNPDQVAE